jgi:hypothetical protein
MNVEIGHRRLKEPGLVCSSIELCALVQGGWVALDGVGWQLEARIDGIFDFPLLLHCFVPA